jgi:carboxypeptidase family protein
LDCGSALDSSLRWNPARSKAPSPLRSAAPLQITGNQKMSFRVEAFGSVAFKNMTMNNSLDRIRIASPCPTSWEQMTGDARLRFCDECKLHVYNISELTRAEAETLIAGAEGRLCARIYRRTDGTVITRDCPVGLRAIRRRVGRLATAAVVLMTTICANVFGHGSKRAVKGDTPASLIRSGGPGAFSITATLDGTITDPAGDAIQNATVTLTNRQTNQRLVAKSNKRGEYHFWVSQFGAYSLEVKAESFQRFYQDHVELHLDDELRFDVSMEISAFIGVVVIEPVRGKGYDIDGTHIRIN